MPSPTSMNVKLSQDLYDFVKAAVKSGRYTSESEVVRDALRSKREGALREIEAKIEVGLAELRAGESVDGPTAMRELRNLGKRRRRSQRADM